MDPKENFLRALYYDDPAYIPLPDEHVQSTVALEGNLCRTNWTDTWGVGWQITSDRYVPFPKVNPLPDLNRVADFRFPDPDALMVSQEMEAVLRQADRERLFVIGSLSYLMFERAWALMGFEACLMAFHTHPQEMQYLLSRIADYNIQVFDRYLEAGVDAIEVSDDLGSQRGLLMSPDTLRQFLLPQYRRCFEHIRSAGRVVRFHSCGCIQDVVTDLAQTGITVLNPIQARANDLARVKADASAARVTLDGGIDSQVLYLGTPAEVRQETLRVMGILGPGGGYILAPDHFGLFPEENQQAMLETAREYGRYPLHVPS